MSTKITRRQLLSLAAQATVIAGAGKLFVSESAAQNGKAGAKYKGAYAVIDGFIKQYMRDMNSPGMSMVLANRSGVLRATAYGFGDLERRLHVQPEQLFHIGSISKSFTAIAILQLREERKLDLHKPILEYLPWLKIETQYAPVTVHHLLTHSAGLPGDVPIFLSDPVARHKTAYAPGEHFHYCNLGYDILGHLLSKLDNRPYAESIRRRILEPLGMDATEPAINSDIRGRTSKNYFTYHDERPYPRKGKLAEAPQLLFEKGSGSIASTAHDMGLYVAMLANRGRAANGHVLSEESFNLFVRPHIKAKIFGPTASYGYGLAIDQMDGHTIARHTGGMVSFMSAMHVDLDEGVGGFASINAQQGYRPNPVVVYALKAIRAANANRVLPPMPPPNLPGKIEKANEYAGVFTSPDGRRMEFVAVGDRLFLAYKGRRLQLEAAGDGFLAQHSDFDRFTINFEREKGEKGKITEVSHGADWYFNQQYTGPRDFSFPKEWEAFVGHYRNDSPWMGSFRVVLRKGKLWLNGTLPLKSVDFNTFRLADSPYNPEWVRFLSVVDGKSMHLKFSGEDFLRVDAK
jgi:CubicO group peptidase (beta-lactamase class C family)